MQSAGPATPAIRRSVCWYVKRCLLARKHRDASVSDTEVRPVTAGSENTSRVGIIAPDIPARRLEYLPSAERCDHKYHVGDPKVLCWKSEYF